MSLENSIDQMILRATAGISQRRSRKIELYSHGIIAKYNNSLLALSILEDLNNLPDDVEVSTDDSNLLVSDRIHFYLDSFFAFLYSTFDVSSQVINQKLQLGLDERKVSFKRIKEELNRHHLGTPLQTTINRICQARYFGNLDKYRNCSTHRRQIYVICETVRVSETPGYNTTAEITSVKRLICDDPFELSPTTNQNRDLIQYSKRILSWTKENLIEIINNIN